jgi:hypothetical protein
MYYVFWYNVPSRIFSDSVMSYLDPPPFFDIVSKPPRNIQITDLCKSQPVQQQQPASDIAPMRSNPSMPKSAYIITSGTTSKTSVFSPTFLSTQYTSLLPPKETL